MNFVSEVPFKQSNATRGPVSTKHQRLQRYLDPPHYPRVSLHCPQMLSRAQAIDLRRVISILGRKDKTWACCQTLDSNWGREFETLPQQAWWSGQVLPCGVKKDQQNLLNPAKPHQSGTLGNHGNQAAKNQLSLCGPVIRSKRPCGRMKDSCSAVNAEKPRNARYAGELDWDGKRKPQQTCKRLQIGIRHSCVQMRGD